LAGLRKMPAQILLGHFLSEKSGQITRNRQLRNGGIAWTKRE
jgi:hypothetical protein